MTVVYPMKLKEEIMPILELKSKEDRTNKAIVLKQLIYTGLQDYVIGLCVKGRISIGKAAEVLDVSIYDIHEIAISKNIKLSADRVQRTVSKETLNKVLKNRG